MWLSTSAMRINELFYSLQGEGYYTGRAAVFVRMSGCNLRCPFCDTDFASYTEMTEEEVCQRVSEACGGLTEGMLVVLTGGEPSLQLTASLVERLHGLGCYVSVETNGTHALPENVDWVTCSPKRGGRVVLTRVSEVKVVYDGEDVEAYRQIGAQHYYLQPMSCSNTDEVVAYIRQHPRWRLSLQTHKLIGIS